MTKANETNQTGVVAGGGALSPKAANQQKQPSEDEKVSEKKVPSRRKTSKINVL